MTFGIITKNREQIFNKEIINISSREDSDFCENFGFEYTITVLYDKETKKCTVLNKYNCQNILFKGEVLPPILEVEKTCRLIIKNSDNYIRITINEDESVPVGNDIKQSLNEKVGFSSSHIKKKEEIEEARVAIIKEVGYKINDLTRRLSMNSKAGILLNIASILASLTAAFAVSNYFSGLSLKEAADIIRMPVNIRFWIAFTIIIYGISLILKQGVFLFFRNKSEAYSAINVAGEKLLIIFSSVLFAGVYTVNLLYYLASGTMMFFAVFMSLLFVFICITLSFACGYYKINNIKLAEELNKYEYREDFEYVIREYRLWIDKYINTFSDSKIADIKDKLFNLHLKSAGEILLGIITAPFLAYGVSNTLAMCFPEAAGWIRISNFKFSPVFLVLASLMIIFAFFIFVNAFVCAKKIQASSIIKNDGFGNYLKHGTEIYGLEAVKRTDAEMRHSFFIGICVVFIEFTMNVSYFMQEMGEDITGMLLSFLGALVPTALLITETYMLGKIKFEIEVSNEILAKIER